MGVVDKTYMWRWLGKSLHQSWHIVALCVGVVIGIILAVALRINYFVSPIWVGCVVAVMMIVYFRPKVVFVVVTLVAGMILAFVRCSGELVNEEYMATLYGQNVIVCGVIDGDPEVEDDATKYKLKDLKFGEDGEYAASGSIFITGMKNENLARGDKVMLKGKMKEGRGTYNGYMYKPETIKWERSEPGDWVLGVRNWFAGRVRGLMSEPQVNLGLSYLLGMRSGLPDELNEKLRTVGLVHIVVASGAHLAILVEVARRLFGKMSRFAGVFFSVIFIVFFMAMIGWTPSIMRAGIMAIIAVIAWAVGRKVEPWRLILLVAAATLLINPMYINNLGWLLSFASFAGIMILGPGLTRYFYGEKKPGFVMGVIMATVAATLMTLPIILYNYGMVSLISVAANLLILPTLSIAMGLVFMTGVVAGIPVIETVVSFAATKMLDFHMAVVDFFGGMKSFVVEIEPYQWWVFLIYILIIVPLAIGLLRRKINAVKCRSIL